MNQVKVSHQKENLVPLSPQRVSPPGLTPVTGQSLWVSKTIRRGRFEIL